MSQWSLGRAFASVVVVAAIFSAGCGGQSGSEIAAGPDDSGVNPTPDATMGTRPDGGTNGSDAGRTVADVGHPAEAATLDAGGAVGMEAMAPSAEAASCGAGTCPMGCCDALGRCQAGVAPGACGVNGGACQDCSASKGLPTCDPTMRQCSANTTACGPSNCQGCCLQNVCFAGTDASLCGSAGQTCASCSTSNQACIGQQCAAAPSCGPGNCAGCCVGTQCFSGSAATTCGQGGGACTDCATTGATCIPVGTGGTCGPPKCGPTNCLAGCCDANGICQMGTTPAACGSGSGICQICPGGTQCTNQRCSCSPASCPTGCCTGFRGLGGTCVTGTLDSQCGVGGQFCSDCNASGGVCTNQQCVFPPPCLCTSGCCDSLGRCQPGAAPTMCGPPGSTCEDCTKSNTVCEGQQCTFVTDVDAGACNALSCPTGCCDTSGACQQGVTGLACGNFGTNCQNCLQSSALCTNQQCVANSDAGQICGPANCAGCCDALGNCLGGFDAPHCGTNGRQCTNCTTMGNQCEFGVCTSPDGAPVCEQSCDGCCDPSGNCQAGFANTQCGEQGATCQDCTALVPPSTCDVLVSPRACTSKQSQCPGPYPSCPAVLVEPPPVRQKVCSTSDLQSAAAACTAGPYTGACAAFLGVVNGPCANCLANFDFEFAEQSGIRTCVAPFVDAACNHNSACIVDCVQESCFNCPDMATTSVCNSEVPSSVCSALAQADACVTQALAGSGAVCNPATYQSNFGAWFQAVGAKYCGP